MSIRLRALIWILVTSLLGPLAPDALRAQDTGELGVLEGQVLARGRREPLAGMGVVLSCGELEREVYTNAKGRFAVADLEPCSWTVSVDADGYAIVSSLVPLAPGQTVSVDLFMDSIVDSAVVYGTEGHRVEDDGATTRDLNQHDIRAVPGARNDPLQALQTLPGVGRSWFSGSLLPLRGGKLGDTQVFLDDVPLPFSTHLGGGRSAMAASFLESVELRSGPYSVQHGGAIGGIVEMTPLQPSGEVFHGVAEVDFLETTALLQGPLSENLQLMASVRRSYLEVFMPVVADVLGEDLGLSPEYSSYLGRLVWKPSLRHTFALAAMGAWDEVRYERAPDSAEGFARVTAASEMHRAWFRHDYRGRGLQHTFLYAAGPSNSEFADAERIYRTATTEHLLREALSLEPDPHLTLHLGADLQFRRLHPSVDATFNPFRPLYEETLDVTSPAAFLEAELEVGDWRGRIGGRVDGDSLADRLSGDVRGSLAWGGDAGGVSFSAGTLSQAPDPAERSLGTVVPRWERAVVAELRGMFALPWYSPLSLELTAWGRRSQDLPRRDTEVLWQPRILPDGEGRAGGLELQLRHALSHGVEGSIAYSLGRAEVRPSADVGWQRELYDQPQNLSAVASVELPAEWRLGLRFSYGTGLPYTPALSELFGTGLETRYDEPFDTEPFHRLDLRVDKAWTFDWWRLVTYVDVQGVYLRANVSFAQRDEGNQPNVMRALSIVPSLGIRGEL